MNPRDNGTRPVLLAAAGSGDAPASCEIAQLVAKHLGAELRVVSVVEPVLVPGFPPEFRDEAMTADQASLAARAKEIKALMEREALAGVAWSSEIRLGRPAIEVCEAAQALNAEMIVVGANPQRRVRRIVSGRRAAQILHLADVPVLSVAPWLHNLPRRIVAGIDFQPASLHAAEAAAKIMQKGGTLKLVHVLPLSFIYPSPQNERDAALRARALRDLEAVAEKMRASIPEGCTIECLTLDGNAADELLNLAERDRADIVATGTRGESAIRRAFVGSVATEVFHSAMVSVLASPGPRDK